MKRIVWLETHAPEVKALALKNLPNGFELVFPESKEDRAEHARLIAGADYLITGSIHVDRAQLEGAKSLRLIQKFGVGVDKIDCEAARDLKIPVYITAGANAAPVAELAVSLMLAANRRVVYIDRTVRAGKWIKPQLRTQCYMLDGKVVGLLGIGNIAKQVVRMLAGFETEMVYYDVNRLSAEDEANLGVRYVPFEELLQVSDILSVHVPLCEATRGMIGVKELAAMKPTSILINTARGGIVDETALIEALRKGGIRGAGLDAFEEEPIGADNPLLAMDNVVLTCHCGGSTIDNMLPRMVHAYGNIERFEAGLPVDSRDIVVGGS